MSKRPSSRSDERPPTILPGGLLQLVRRYRIPALFCAFAVLLCELISRPFAAMGICDDWSYTRSAQDLLSTGHIVYNGWAMPFQGWQLYLGAAFIKLFGFSFTAVRMSTLLVAMALAFLLQRTLVRSGITERNATLATLAFVLSPLYLMLSATFMNDIHGTFAIVICLYGCLRALQASTSRATIAWLVFAVAANALFGSARQISWLGILVMLPSTLWLLRARRAVLLSGAAATLAGVLFIFGCLQWFKRQPYSVPDQLIPNTLPIAHTLAQVFHTLLDIPFLLLPIIALFFPRIRRSRPRILVGLAAVSLAYLLLALHWRHTHPDFLLEPTLGDWLGIHGIYEVTELKGTPPIFLTPLARVLLTVLSIGGLLGLLASLLQHHTPPTTAPAPNTRIPWLQLNTLLLPFTFASAFLIFAHSAMFVINDRYLLALVFVALLYLVRYYQQAIHPRLPLATLALIALMATYGIAITHNLFSLYRARVALAAEIHSTGVPYTSVDNGWEYNMTVELQHSNHINNILIDNPAHAHLPVPPLPSTTCPMNHFDLTPHIHPLFGVSFDPNACYGPAPFAPVHYSRWLSHSPGTLYAVRYTPPSKP